MGEHGVCIACMMMVTRDVWLPDLFSLFLFPFLFFLLFNPIFFCSEREGGGGVIFLYPYCNSYKHLAWRIGDDGWDGSTFRIERNWFLSRTEGD